MTTAAPEKEVAEIQRQLTVCPRCGAKVPVGNFCSECTRKMVEACDCWRLNRRFDCGFDRCSTMGALIKKFGYDVLLAQDSKVNYATYRECVRKINDAFQHFTNSNKQPTSVKRRIWDKKFKEPRQEVDEKVVLSLTLSVISILLSILSLIGLSLQN